VPMGKAISPEKKEEIAKMGRLGYTPKRIAEAFGLHGDTVRRVLREKGVKPKRGRVPSYIYGD